jgi:hypothetical protein
MRNTVSSYLVVAPSAKWTCSSCSSSRIGAAPLAATSFGKGVGVTQAGAGAITGLSAAA